MKKYCVASVCVDLERVRTYVGYYAQGTHGLYLTSSWENENVIWYDTEDEAMEHRLNANNCVLCFCTDCIPKFKKEEVRKRC
ncbi:MAG: hypothetical protein ACI4F9_07720 [Lachnospiraceae bacterium]